MESKGKKSDSEVITINIQPLLVPISILLSTIIFSSFFLLGVHNLGNSIKESGGITKSDNDNNDDGNSGDTVVEDTAGVIEEGVVSIDDDPYLGDKDDAKVAIVEFSDFECPFCSRFHTETYDSIISDYVDTGDAIFVYRDFPLSFHPSAEPLAIAGYCVQREAGNEKFFEAGKKFFAAFDDGVSPTDEEIIEMAVSAGVDKSDFEDCYNNDKEEAKSEISADTNDGIAAGITGTPGFIVGVLDEDGNVTGEIVSGAQPFSVFQAAIERQLDNAN